ncbi:CRISPR-associated protein Cas5h [Clostridium moniliforme]|uniref:CRISPR-associated protein Cas5h n=1 Tax=Clostridium moniliforme TaxID=39489 RepID=A0ABS4EXR7_9CLOT|nr:type I-B CRISPR-associated protein Cas5b [Clostridium moniliforme]MBP1888792.1 CRISPR-associated protein Cas5h [Clostridium moniliforme]
MQALKFTLRGSTAFFKKPDVNSYLYFTYGHIHKVALTGLFGAILGYKGYNSMNSYCKKNKKDKKDQNNIDFPEFYEKLKDLKISIVPNNENGIIDKKVNVFNNSVGYASKEQGGNLIVKEQWLENPSWDIYVLLDNEEAIKVSESILNKSYIYIPYLGKNDHMAEIIHPSLEECEKITHAHYINSFFIKGTYKLEINYEDDEEDDDENEKNIRNVFKYEERLPLKLDAETNKYILEDLIYTNNYLEEIDGSLSYKVLNKNIQFI